MNYLCNITTSILERKNIWHFCNILYTGSATPTSRIYMTPTVSSPVVQGSTGSGPLLMPNTKVEARRRLNLDSALVDRDGFKTPIKGTKRKHDFSSPSPKKCKFFFTPYALMRHQHWFVESFVNIRVRKNLYFDNTIISKNTYFPM